MQAWRAVHRHGTRSSHLHRSKHSIPTPLHHCTIATCSSSATAGAQVQGPSCAASPEARACGTCRLVASAGCSVQHRCRPCSTTAPPSLACMWQWPWRRQLPALMAASCCCSCAQLPAAEFCRILQSQPASGREGHAVDPATAPCPLDHHHPSNTPPALSRDTHKKQ